MRRRSARAVAVLGVVVAAAAGTPAAAAAPARPAAATASSASGSPSATSPSPEPSPTPSPTSTPVGSAPAGSAPGGPPGPGAPPADTGGATPAEPEATPSGPAPAPAPAPAPPPGTRPPAPQAGGAPLPASAAAAPTPAPTTVPTAAPLPVPVVLAPLPVPVPDPGAVKALRDSQVGHASAQDAASAALERYATSLRRAEAATRQEQALHRALSDLFTETARARRGLAVWVGQLYRAGGNDPRLALLTRVLEADDAEELLRGLDRVERVAGRYAGSYRALRASARRQEGLSDRAADAAARARSAALDAQQARSLAQAVVEQTAARLGHARTVVAAQTSVLPPAGALAPAAGATGAGRPGLAGQDCPGGSLAGYPNGQLPLAALCGLPGTPGLLLRADAAAAFVRMSAAFQAALGRPLCVSDAYRDLPSQVAVAAAKPALAAVPGRSKHGWGVAVDLCGGVQSYDTPQHAWLATHAPAFGWYLPSWAQRDGSRPEPWHWEFAG